MTGSPILPESDADHGLQGFPEVHLWDYVEIVLQRLPLAATVFASVLVIGILYTWTRTPLYEATARILVERTQIDLTDFKGVHDPTGGINQREFIETQARLITSAPVLETAFEKANLLNDPFFSGKRDPINTLTKLIQVTPIRNTHLIDISIRRPAPAQAATIVNATVSAFLENNRSRRLGISEEGLAELRRQADRLRQNLDIATENLQVFMVENRILSFERTQNVILDRLRDLSRELNQTEPRRMILEARIQTAENAIQQGQRIENLPEIIDSPVIRQMKSELARLELDYSQKLQRFGDEHPQLLATEHQMDAMRTRLALEARTVLDAIRLEYQQVLRQEELLRESIQEQEAEVVRFNGLAAEYNLLNQTQKSIENTYHRIIRRIEEIDINRMGGQGDNVFIISSASVPTVQAYPAKTRNMLATLFIAGALSVAICFFLDYMDTTIKLDHDVTTLLGAPVLAGIPNVHRELPEDDNPDLFMLQNPRSHFAEAFRALRTALAFCMQGKQLHRVVISSVMPSEGKSLTAISLAIAQAQSGRKVLLIDADLRKPRLHTVFQSTTTAGLSALLQEQDSPVPQALIQSTPIDNLSFLPAGPVPSNPVEMLDSQRFDELLNELSASYDFLVIDSPPGISLVDALVMAKRTDGLLLVLRSFVTQKRAAQFVVNRLAEAKIDLLGVVLNHIDMPQHQYYTNNYYCYGGPYYHQEAPAGNLARMKALFSQWRKQPPDA